MSRKRNLLLAFDAFALRHGIRCVDKPDHELKPEDYAPVKKAFSHAFKHESSQNPNYGKAAGLGPEKWWANVIRGTFKPFLKPSQEVPEALISDLIARFSTREGYDLFPDVLPFFHMLRNPTLQKSASPPWPWNKTVVGIITNSDDRAPSVLESFGLKIGPRRVGNSVERVAKSTTVDDISFVVLSYDVGIEKPDRRMFQAAEAMLRETLADDNRNPEDVDIQDYEKLYVGDSLEHDYLGATAAGWHSVLVERGRPLKEPLTKLDATEFQENSESSEQVVVCAGFEALQHWRPSVS